MSLSPLLPNVFFRLLYTCYRTKLTWMMYNQSFVSHWQHYMCSILKLFPETVFFTWVCTKRSVEVVVILTRTQPLLLPWDLLQMFLSHVLLLKPEPWLPYQNHFQCLARQKMACYYKIMCLYNRAFTWKQ